MKTNNIYLIMTMKRSYLKSNRHFASYFHYIKKELFNKEFDPRAR
jgi:hypothetical protein